MTDSFDLNMALGFLIGVFGTVIVLVIYGLYRGFVARMRAPFQPQIVIHKTTKTPAEVIAEANRARVKLLLLIIAVMLSVLTVLEILFPGTLRVIFGVFGN
jgi:hypothetical protein